MKKLAVFAALAAVGVISTRVLRRQRGFVLSSTEKRSLRDDVNEDAGKMGDNAAVAKLVKTARASRQDAQKPPAAPPASAAVPAGSSSLFLRARGIITHDEITNALKNVLPMSRQSVAGSWVLVMDVNGFYDPAGIKTANGLPLVALRVDADPDLKLAAVDAGNPSTFGTWSSPVNITTDAASKQFLKYIDVADDRRSGFYMSCGLTDPDHLLCEYQWQTVMEPDAQAGTISIGGEWIDYKYKYFGFGRDRSAALATH